MQDDPFALEVSKYFVRRIFDDMEGPDSQRVSVKSVLRYLARHPEVWVKGTVGYLSFGPI